MLQLKQNDMAGFCDLINGLSHYSEVRKMMLKIMWVLTRGKCIQVQV